MGAFRLAELLRYTGEGGNTMGAAELVGVALILMVASATIAAMVANVSLALKVRAYEVIITMWVLCLAYVILQTGWLR